MWTALFSQLREVHKRSAAKEERLMKPAEASNHKQAAVAAGSKMTAVQSPVGLRSVVSSLVAFFIVVSSVSLLLDRGQEPQVQLAVEQHQHQEVQVKHPATSAAAAAAGEQKSLDRSSSRSPGQEAQAQWASELLDAARDDAGEECNWSLGRWVYDNASRPLYSGLKCAFIFDEVACDKYGRNDTMYQHWRWQPHGCNRISGGKYQQEQDQNLFCRLITCPFLVRERTDSSCITSISAAKHPSCLTTARTPIPRCSGGSSFL